MTTGESAAAEARMKRYCRIEYLSDVLDLKERADLVHKIYLVVDRVAKSQKKIEDGEAHVSALGEVLSKGDGNEWAEIDDILNKAEQKKRLEMGKGEMAEPLATCVVMAPADLCGDVKQYPFTPQQEARRREDLFRAEQKIKNREKARTTPVVCDIPHKKSNRHPCTRPGTHAGPTLSQRCRDNCGYETARCEAHGGAAQARKAEGVHHATQHSRPGKARK